MGETDSKPSVAMHCGKYYNAGNAEAGTVFQQKDVLDEILKS